MKKTTDRSITGGFAKSARGIFILVILHYYTHVTGFLAYFLALARMKRSIKITHLPILILISMFFIIQGGLKNPWSWLYDVRLYWGWLIFWAYFKTYTLDSSFLKKAVVFLSCAVFIEVLLINTVIPPEVLPNFPSDKALAWSHFAPEGDYKKPYSFGGSATVGSAVLVVLMAVAEVTGYRLLLGILAVIAFSSGTGYVVLILFLAFRFLRWDFIFRNPRIFVLLLLVAFALFNLPGHILDQSGLVKITPAYLEMTFFYKLDQFLLLDSTNQVITNFGIDQTKPYADFGFNVGTFFGDYINADTNLRGGDFGWLTFFQFNGIVGSLILLLFVLANLNRRNWLPLFLLFVSTMEYSTLFFFPGQLLFAMSLGLRPYLIPPCHVGGKSKRLFLTRPMDNFAE